MRAIGGYFELADFSAEEFAFPHKNGILLESARNALKYILLSLSDVKCIWIPYYSCEALSEPIREIGLNICYYHVNQYLELDEIIELHKNEYLIAVNYFGIKDEYILSLSKLYKSQLIVDNSQAFFAIQQPKIKTIYSCRKFLGVADGGIAYTDKLLHGAFLESKTSSHDSHLYIRKKNDPEVGFTDYQVNEKKLSHQPIKRMSKKTVGILNHIDYPQVIKRRNENFSILHNTLKEINLMDIPNSNSYISPMVYPYLCMNDSLRAKLISARIFVATYWQNVIDSYSESSIEYQLAKYIIPLPCDQRYGKDDMERILDVIL